MTSRGRQIHPIRTEQDREFTVVRIGQLMNAEPGSLQGDELDLLATFVASYEGKYHPINPPDPVVAIQFRMEQLGFTRKDLKPLIGSRATVSEILNRKRNLTLEMVRRVRSGLGISEDLLIAPLPGRTPRRRVSN